MLFRFRRKRFTIIFILLILTFIYLLDNQTDNQIIAENDSFDKEINKPSKQYKDEVMCDNTTTTVEVLSRTIREEIIEINGTKLRKIDWHDYEMIARENNRTGIFSIFID